MTLYNVYIIVLKFFFLSQFTNLLSHDYINNPRTWTCKNALLRCNHSDMCNFGAQGKYKQSSLNSKE